MALSDELCFITSWHGQHAQCFSEEHMALGWRKAGRKQSSKTLRPDTHLDVTLTNTYLNIIAHADLE